MINKYFNEIKDILNTAKIDCNCEKWDNCKGKYNDKIEIQLKDRLIDIDNYINGMIEDDCYENYSEIEFDREQFINNAIIKLINCNKCKEENEKIKEQIIFEGNCIYHE